MVHYLKPLTKNIIVLAIFFLFFYLIKTSLEGDAGKIRRLVFSTKNAAEKENLLKCIWPLSFNYSDEYGNNRDSLVMVLKELFSYWDGIHIYVKDLKVKLDGHQAKAEISALEIARIAGQEKENLDSQFVHFIAYFNKEKDGWKVIRLEFLEPKDMFGLIS